MLPSTTYQLDPHLKFAPTVALNEKNVLAVKRLRRAFDDLYIANICAKKPETK